MNMPRPPEFLHRLEVDFVMLLSNIHSDSDEIDFPKYGG